MKKIWFSPATNQENIYDDVDAHSNAEVSFKFLISVLRLISFDSFLLDNEKEFIQMFLRDEKDTRKEKKIENNGKWALRILGYDTHERRKRLI